MSVHLMFFRAVMQACLISCLIFSGVWSSDPQLIIFGLMGAGLFAIALAIIHADAHADRRSDELKDLVAKWMESQKRAEAADRRRASAMPRAMADGPPLLPKRAPLEPGRRFPIQTLTNELRVEVTV